MHQYLSWFKRGVSYPSGNKLNSYEAILKLKAMLLPTNCEVHESVQRFDGLGRVVFTPIYADFDGLESASDVVKFVEAFESEFKVTPDIFFSGNRGYHVFINTPVSHAYPHLVVEKIVTIMSKSKYLDPQMYTSRHLLRSEGSIHFKSNLFKTRLNKSDLLNSDVKVLARKQRVTQVGPHSSHILELFLNSMYELVDRDIAEAEEKYKSIKLELKGDVAPCIKTLITQGPVPGSNNSILVLIARNLNSVGVGMDDAIARVMGEPKWMAHGKEIIATFKSTYKQPSRFGCKNNELLKRHCDQFCPFNELTIDIM